MNVYWKNEWTTPAAVGVVSFAAGAAVGYFVYKKKADKELDLAITAMQDFIAEENEKAKAGPVYGKKIEEIEEPLKLGNIIRPHIKDLGVIPDVATTWNEIVTSKDLPTGDGREKIQEPVAERHNVFEDQWDVAEEMANRSPDAPYVIHANEFFNREKGYQQTQLEWYEGDKILSDENNVPIYDPERVVGRLEFGRGSGDPNVVYIRNERLNAEYEITKNEGSYTFEVLGVEAEEAAEQNDLKHSNHIRRFRPSD